MNSFQIREDQGNFSWTHQRLLKNLSLAQKSERDRRHKNYLASATMEYSAISDTLECTADENEEVQDSVSDIGDIQYISAVRTRSTKSFSDNGELITNCVSYILNNC